MNFVRNENDADWRARDRSARCLYGVEQCDIGGVVMLRALIDLHSRSMNTPTHSIRINLDLTARQPQQPLGSGLTHNSHSQQATLLSLAMSYLDALSLTIDKCTFDSSNDLLAFGRDDVLDSMSDLDKVRKLLVLRIL